MIDALDSSTMQLPHPSTYTYCKRGLDKFYHKLGTHCNQALQAHSYLRHLQPLSFYQHVMASYIGDKMRGATLPESRVDTHAPNTPHDTQATIHSP